MARIREFSPAFLVRSAWDPVMEDYGGTVHDLRHVNHFFHCPAHRRSREFWHALFLTEMSPRWLKQPLGTAIELLAAVRFTSKSNLEVCDCSLFLASPCGESTLETKVNFIFSSIIKRLPKI